MYNPKLGLLHLSETVSKERLFSHYFWVTGTSSLAKEYSNQFFLKVTDISAIVKDDFVIEIASNDGTFLKPFIDTGYTNVLGVEPAKNIAEIAKKNGIKTEVDFWGHQKAVEIMNKRGPSKLIFARNVIAHVEDIGGVLDGVQHVLAEDGVGVFEFHYSMDILEELHYDSIYHEHIYYFSLTSFETLLKQHNLYSFDCHFSPINGGSLAVYCSREKKEKSDDYSRLKEKEIQKKVNSLEAWQDFGKKCNNHRTECIEFLQQYKEKRIVAFGASARSSTFLNYCGFDSNVIKAIVDNNPLKVGKFTPGTNIPIINLEEGLTLKPDIILITAWNFKDEVMNQCIVNGYSNDFIVMFPDSPQLIKGQIHEV